MKCKNNAPVYCCSSVGVGSNAKELRNIIECLFCLHVMCQAVCCVMSCAVTAVCDVVLCVMPCAVCDVVLCVMPCAVCDVMYCVCGVMCCV